MSWRLAFLARKEGRTEGGGKSPFGDMLEIPPLLFLSLVCGQECRREEEKKVWKRSNESSSCSRSEWVFFFGSYRMRWNLLLLLSP